MNLSFYQLGGADTESRAQANPLPATPVTWEERFAAARDEMLYVNSSISESSATANVIQEYLDRFREATGERLINPIMAMGPDAPLEITMPEIRRRFAEYRAQHPESDLAFPSDEEIHQEMLARIRPIEQRAGDVANRPSSLTGAIMGFAGGAAGGMADPINLSTMALGGGAARSILRGALIDAGVGAASQAAIEASTWQLHQELNPSFGLRDAAGNVLATGAGAFALSGLLRGAGRLLQRRSASGQAATEGAAPGAYGAPPEASPAGAQAVPAPASREVEDALNVLERQDWYDRTNPHAPGDAAAAAAHRARLAEAEVAIAAGRSVDVDRLGNTESVPSQSGRVWSSTNRPIDVEYRVVEGDQLSPAGSDLQPRDRTRAASDAWITETAANLEPERLGRGADASTGAPIVGPDSVIESGNGRWAAIRRAYAEGGEPAARYRDWLQGQGYDIAGMRQPMLVRVRTSELTPGQRQAFVTEAQSSGTLRMSPAELALDDARQIPAIIDQYRGGEVGSAANSDFQRSFLQRLGSAEAAGLRDANGQLSQAGMRRLEGAMMAHAYGDAALVRRLFEDQQSNIKAIGNGLLDASGAWSRLRAAAARNEVAPGMDVTGDLMAAVQAVVEARRLGRPIEELLQQGDLFGGGLSPIGRAFLRTFFRNENLTGAAGRRSIGEALAGFVDEALRQRVDQGRLFGEPLTAAQILRTEELTDATISGPPPPPPVPRDEALAAVATAAEPDQLRAQAVELQRHLDQFPDATVGIEAADGSIVYRPMKEVLADQARERAAARAILGCAIGGAL